MKEHRRSEVGFYAGVFVGAAIATVLVLVGIAFLVFTDPVVMP